MFVPIKIVEIAHWAYSVGVEFAELFGADRGAHQVNSPDEFERSLKDLFAHPDMKDAISGFRSEGRSEQVLISHLKSAHRFRAALKKDLKCEALLSELCKAGCTEERLLLLLFKSCAAANSEPVPLLDTAGLSSAQLKALRRDLLHIAGLVKSVNETSLNPKFDLKWAPPNAETGPLRAGVELLYDTLPGTMQTYAVHLEQFERLNRKILKRLTVAQYYALKLLRYVDETTGSPRYQAAADLFAVAFPALCEDAAKMPNSFSADALSKLYTRTTALDKRSPKKT